MRMLLIGVFVAALNIAWFLCILALGIYALRAFGII